MATLYRNWSSSDTTVSTNHYNTGGQFPSPNSLYDDTGALQDWSKDGYYFVEWNTYSDGTGDSQAPNDWITQDIDYYAIWAEIQPSVVINYGNTTIVSMSQSGTEILDTLGKYMSDNVTVEYDSPLVIQSFSIYGDSGVVDMVLYLDANGNLQTATPELPDYAGQPILSATSVKNGMVVYFASPMTVISSTSHLSLAKSVSLGTRASFRWAYIYVVT